MSILFLVLIIVAVMIVLFVFRARIASVTAGVGAHAVATWYDFLTYVWPAIRRTVILALFVFTIPWFLFVVLMVCLGAYGSSIPSAAIISILFPIWFLAFIMPQIASRIWILGPMIRVVKVVFLPILIIATIFLFVGLWSPTVKISLDRWFGNSKQAMANSLDKSSVQSEAEAGVFGFLPEETWVYNEAGQPFRKLSKGTLVRALSLEGKSAWESSEGMVNVMLPNDSGDFVSGNTGYVPSRKINWDWKDAQAAKAFKEDIEAKLKMDQEVAAKEEASILHGSGVMRVSYNTHDPIEGGSKRIASLPPGKWRMNISGVHKQYYSDVGYVDISPEGRVGLRLKFQKDFPVPEASPGARVVKIGTDPWKYAGEEIEFETFAEKTDVWVTINQRQSNPDNFLQNKGGDKIKIKRVGQMSAALFL